MEEGGGGGGVALPAVVLRNLSDKLYEKRKTAAIEVEQTVKNLATSSSAAADASVHAVVRLLVDDYALSPHANYRKGGLIGLAAVTVGLSCDRAKLETHLSTIVPPVLHSFTDQDSRLRYFACESLYNIAKASRASFVRFFLDVFDALAKLSADSDSNVQNAAHLLDRLVKDIVAESPRFDIEAFMPRLTEAMTALNPYVRQFLVSWIGVLHSVPDFDMVAFLPDFLDGLLNMLSDANMEIRQQVELALAEFMHDIKEAAGREDMCADYGRISLILVGRAGSPDVTTRLKAISWIKEMVALANAEILPYFASILGAILPCLSHTEKRVRDVAAHTNDELLALDTQTRAEQFDVASSVAVLCDASSSAGEALTRKEALRWMAALLERHRSGTLRCLDTMSPAVLAGVSDNDKDVVREALDVIATIASDRHLVRGLMTALLDKFRGEEGRWLLGRRGAFILRGLAEILGAEYTFRELAAILVDEQDPKFAFDAVQALNVILLTAPEFLGMRLLLQTSLVSKDGGNLFLALYSCWCHNSVAAVSLCLLAQTYNHSADIIRNMNEEDITPSMLAQLDRLVQLLETPIFVSLRLQLLQPDQNAALFESLFGILMLLPQTSAYEVLRNRLHSAPKVALNSRHDDHTPTRLQKTPSRTKGHKDAVELDFPQMLLEFHNKQKVQREYTRRQGRVPESPSVAVVYSNRHGNGNGSGNGGSGSLASPNQKGGDGAPLPTTTTRTTTTTLSMDRDESAT